MQLMDLTVVIKTDKGKIYSRGFMDTPARRDDIKWKIATGCLPFKVRGNVVSVEMFTPEEKLTVVDSKRGTYPKIGSGSNG